MTIRPDDVLIRLLVCHTCRTIDELPPFEGTNPDDDVLLQLTVAKHGPEHKGKLANVSLVLWQSKTMRPKIVEQLQEGSSGLDVFGTNFYATRMSFHEDAMKCYSQHLRPKGQCSEFHSEKKRLLPDTAVERKEVGMAPVQSGPKVYICDFCLSADTEVVTREGIKTIGELAAQGRGNLLVPFTGKHGGLTSRGSWQDAEVRYLGEQATYQVALRKGKKRKIVTATAEHRWFLADPGRPEVRTSALAVGDRLQSIRAVPLRDGIEVPFAVAQGFVFGDGSHGRHDGRPACVAFHGDKEALLPYFATCRVKAVTMNGSSVQEAVHLPRHWKALPPLEESRSFLLSWLAGYFAADGTVDARGSASISSASPENVHFVRDVLAVCGIEYGQVLSRERSGFGEEPSAVYTLSLNASQVPSWFWKLPKHAARAAVHRGSRALDWVVESVTPTGTVDPVFCAVVPGAGAFGLADDLLTGNCPVRSFNERKLNEARGIA